MAIYVGNTKVKPSGIGKVYVGNTLVYEKASAQPITYYFNATVNHDETSGMGDQYDVNFTCNGVNYDSMLLTFYGSVTKMIGYKPQGQTRYTSVYSRSWTNENYRTITFPAGTVIPDGLQAFLDENATMV